MAGTDFTHKRTLIANQTRSKKLHACLRSKLCKITSHYNRLTQRAHITQVFKLLNYNILHIEDL